MSRWQRCSASWHACGAGGVGRNPAEGQARGFSALSDKTHMVHMGGLRSLPFSAVPNQTPEAVANVYMDIQYVYKIDR